MEGGAREGKPGFPHLNRGHEGRELGGAAGRPRRGPGTGSCRRTWGEPSNTLFFFIVLSRILRLGYKTFKGPRKDPREPGPEMSLESLYQHIIFSELQAKESRHLMREGRRDTWVVCVGPLSSPVGGSGQKAVSKAVVRAVRGVCFPHRGKDS